MARTYGLYFGNLHSECGKNGCGIKQKVAETGDLIEVEGGEWWIPKQVMESSDVHTFKKKTNAQILKAITDKYDKTKVSGVVNSGDFIVMRAVVNDRKQHNRRGTVSDIVNKMQSEHGGRMSNGYKFKEGGYINRIYLGQDGGSNVSTSFDRAVSLSKKGFTNEAIRQLTGWFRNPFDKLWRYEISDENSVIHNNKINDIFIVVKDKPDKWIQVSLSDIYSNEILYKAYPNIKNISVYFVWQVGVGIASVIVPDGLKKPIIKYNLYEDSKLYESSAKRGNGGDNEIGKIRKGIFTHELQHIVQIREGLSGGSSALWEYRELLENFQRENPDMEISDNIKSSLYSQATERLKNSAGEIEARSAEKRIDYNEIRREINIPYKDVRFDSDNVIVNLESKIEFKMGGKISDLKAPNGKPSNLTHEQHKLVRTKAFKDWFGDWENDPKNASKVVDDNGEPLVVWHGTKNNIKILVPQLIKTIDGKKVIDGQKMRYIADSFFEKLKKYPYTVFEKSEKTHVGTSESITHFFFTSNKNVADTYAKDDIRVNGFEGRNIKFDSDGNLVEYYPSAFDLRMELRLFGDDVKKERIILEAKKKGIIVKDLIYLRYSYKIIAKRENLHDLRYQKYSGYEFDYFNEYDKKNDIRLGAIYGFVGAYFLNIKNAKITDFNGKNWNSVTGEDSMNKFIENSYKKYDGTIIKNVVDIAGFGDETPSNNYIVFDSKNIKLADGSNTTFDSSNPDIRFREGGEVDQKRETYKKWKSLVNMSKSELKKFYDSDEGKTAGLRESEARSMGISNGRESARWIIKMKDTPVSKWTPQMWKWANKQISFISRMRGNKGDLYDDGKRTRKHLSLLIWGHNPERYKDGGEVGVTHKLTMYQVLQSAPEWTESKYLGTDYDEAKKEFDYAEPDEKSNVTYILEKREDEYKFVGDWRGSGYESEEEMMSVYPLEDYYEYGSVWELIDEGDWNDVDSIDVKSYKNQKSEDEEEKSEELRESITKYIIGISKEWKTAAYLGSTFYALIPYKNGNIQVRVADHFFNPDNVKLGLNKLWDYIEGNSEFNKYADIYGFLSINITDSNYQDRHGFWRDHKDKIRDMEYSGLIEYIDYDISDIEDIENVNFKEDINDKLDEIKSEIDDAIEGGMFTEENPDIEYELGGEIKKGTKVEMEHLDTIHKFKRKGVSDKTIAESIAKDHLKEDSEYYTKLAEMEKQFKRGQYVNTR